MKDQIENGEKIVDLKECLKNADVNVYVIEKGIDSATGERENGFYVDASSDMNNEMAKQDFDSLADAFEFLKANNVKEFKVNPNYPFFFEGDE